MLFKVLGNRSVWDVFFRFGDMTHISPKNEIYIMIYLGDGIQA